MGTETTARPTENAGKGGPRRAPALTFGQRAILFAGLVTLNLPGTICTAGMAPPVRIHSPGSGQAVVMSEENTLPSACIAPVGKVAFPTMIRSSHKGNE
ncbi:MAG: hypothetical protein PHY95_02470 [Candidatus ainarchaeum sp.]|nr:hypothetical protein [Candidatus ainarchaeum sp.]